MLKSPSYLIIKIEIMSDTWQRQMAGRGPLLRSLPTLKSVSFWVHKRPEDIPKVFGSQHLGLQLLLQPHDGPNSGPTMQTAGEGIRRGGGVETFLPAGMNGKSMRRMMGKRERQWGDEAGVCSLELSAFCITCMLRNHKMYMHQGFRAQDSSQWAGAINVFLGFGELKGKHRGILKSFLGRSFRFHPKWVLVWDQKHLAQIWAILLKTVSKSFKLPEPELPHLETGGSK